MLLHTYTKNDTYLLKTNNDGKIYKAAFNEDEKTLVDNTVKFTRLLRKVQENIHSNLKHKFKLLNRKKMSNKFLDPFSRTDFESFGLPNSYKDVPKINYVLVTCCSLLNSLHHGYKPLYMNDTDQVQIAENLQMRLNIENPLYYTELWPIDFRGAVGRGQWTKLTFRDHFRHDVLGFPTLTNAQINPIAVTLVGGIHALTKANDILNYMNILPLKDMNMSRDEVLQACDTYPDHWEFEYLHINESSTPSWWDSAKFGDFKNCTVIRCLIPPTMKSERLRSNYHTAVIIFGNDPSDRLGLSPPYNRIYFWKCISCPSKCGSLGMDKHCAALLNLLSFKQTYRNSTRVCNLLNTTTCERRQGQLILPPTNSSANIPQDVPRSRDNWRAHIHGEINPFYDTTHSSGKYIQL